MILIVFFLSIFVIFFYLKYRLNYWKRKNVAYVPSNVFKAVAMQFHYPVSLFDHYMAMYRKLSGHAYGGCFFHFRPQLLVREPELIKHILSKDFDHFRDRGSVNFDERDPLTNHIFSAPGDLWRALRIRLTPTFTSGKMKFMFGVVKECAEEYQKFIEKPAAHGLPLDISNVSVGYTTEVINSAAFGLKTNSIANDKSEFKRIARLIYKSGYLRLRLRLIIREWLPFLKSIVCVSLFQPEVTRFFFNTVRNTVRYRNETGYKRNDFLQILIDLNNAERIEKKEVDDRPSVRRSGSHELEMTTELMTAQCFVFFVAGFDTSSLVLSLTLLEIAINSNIQKKLQKEIDKSVKESDNQITYEMIKNMPYLHQVVQETMRKYPVLPMISRICTKTYRLPDTDLVVEKGTEIIVPLPGIHRNEEYYPDPEKYDPERFDEERIRERPDFTYLPFGDGPRNCIGSRFGLMSVKLGLIHLLTVYDFETTSETQYPVKFKPYKIVTGCDHPVILKCTTRSEKFV